MFPPAVDAAVYRLRVKSAKDARARQHDMNAHLLRELTLYRLASLYRLT
jgi:hypothetical protein